MLMPGRKFSAGSGYRYGFNGQEKETELNENITTAQFWEYDSRIGRRWNIDPVDKNSPYEVNSSNPITMSDPWGDDDFWALNPKSGKVVYLGSTSKGRNINIIVTTANMAMTKGGKLDQVPNLVSQYQNTSKLISDIKINFRKEPITKGIADIISTYAVSAGLEVSCDPSMGAVGIASEPINAIAFTDGDDGDNIYINAQDGNISPLMSDWGNLQSTLKHEKTHRGQGPAPAIEHSKITIDQLADSYGSITDDFAMLLFKNAYSYLKLAAKTNAEDPALKKQTSDFEGLQIMYNMRVSTVPLKDNKELIQVKNIVSGQEELFDFDPDIK